MGIVSKGLRHIEDVCLLSQTVCIKQAYETGTAGSKENMGTLIFNWNYFYELQRNTKGFCSCLVCYQLY